MANQDDDNKATEKHTPAFDSDDLMDSDLLIDADELVDSDELIDSDELLDLDEPLEELSDALHASATERSSSEIDNIELDIPEHAIAEEAQHAAERATKAAVEAEAKATQEAQIAIDAKAAAEEAMAVAEAAEKMAEEAKVVAATTAEAESKAAEEAQEALDAESKAIAEAKAKTEEEARIQAEEEARIQAEEEARIQAEEEARIQAEEEARIQAEEEARLQAEEEALIQAEEEARIQAEEEARIQAEEEARLQAEEEARIQAEEEARIQAEEEARLQAEEEARVQAEEEARLQAEEEARVQVESEKIKSSLESEEFLSLNLDEDEASPQDGGLETLTSLEKELGELTEWIEPELGSDLDTMDLNETAHLQNPKQTGSEADVVSEQEPEKETTTTTDKTKDEPMTANKKSGLSSLMLSATLISMVIAALAIWMSLDAAQQTANLAQEPVKLQKQIDHMNEHQEKQTLLLQEQIKNLQQQLTILTNVVSHKESEKWRDAIEKPLIEKPVVAKKEVIAKVAEKTIAVQPAPVTTKKIAKAKLKTVVKPVIKQLKKTDPAVINTPVIASEYATDPASVQGWVVYLFSSKSQKSAERETRQFQKKGIDAKYLRTTSKGKIWYHVLVSGFEDARKAAAFKKFMKEYHGIDSYYNKSANPITELKVQKATPVKKASIYKKPKQSALKKTATKTSTKTATIVNHVYRFQAVNAEVWLQISAPNQNAAGKGKLLKEVLLKAGHHINIKATSESLWITAGNAPALSISVDGKVVAKKGSLGTGKKVLRNYRFSIKP